MASSSSPAGLFFLSRIPSTPKSQAFSFPKPSFAALRPNLLSLPSISPYSSHNFALFQTSSKALLSCKCSSTFPVATRSYEFSDSSSEVELRIHIGGQDVQNPRDISVDANHTSLAVRVQRPGSPVTLIETNNLFDKIKPDETIWFVQLKAIKLRVRF